jgi:hypothetical protein
MRVISSPSSSTTGLATLILSIENLGMLCSAGYSVVSGDPSKRLGAVSE